MPLFPIFDDERRRLLTPGINPNAPLPDLPTRRPAILPPAGNPGDMTPPSYTPEDYSQPTRSQRYEAEKQAYMRTTPGRGKSALTGALQGFAQGGLPGAIFGGISGAADPRALREQQFNQRRRPQILERFGMEDQDRTAQLAGQKTQQEYEYNQARINDLNRQHLPQMAKPRAPISAPGRGLYDLDAGQIIPGTEPLPRTERPLAPHWVETDKGYVDLNAPENKGKTFRGRRSATGGGRSSGGSQKEMRSARVDMGQFERLKGEAIRAQQDGDDALYSAKRNEMEAVASRIDALYGDSVEVGESDGWPYVKFRQAGRSAAPQRTTGAPKRSRAESYKILRSGGYSDAEANSELNRLGIE